MAGTKEGGKKAAITNRQRYGIDFYRQIGHKGGTISQGGGFAQVPGLASEAGRRGAIASHISKELAKAARQQREIHKLSESAGTN